MKTVILVSITLLAFGIPSRAQLCPGGGVDFSSAVTFDPSWIYGCNTGTSCNGGVSLSNKAACQPTLALDACAPLPTCGLAGLLSASNIWFKFVATTPTATISCFQNSSFVIGIQAFSGGLLCGTLSQLGCALAGGPSSGVQLNLSGLVPGTVYYFRIFGSAGPASQRTGIYCFCGSTGLSGALLPMVFNSFSGQPAVTGITLNWTATPLPGAAGFKIERSADGNTFYPLADVPAPGTGMTGRFQYTDPFPLAGTGYYRLQQAAANGQAIYSDIISIKAETAGSRSVYYSSAEQALHISVPVQTRFMVTDMQGRPLQTLRLPPGTHRLPLDRLGNGFYLLRAEGRPAEKFYVGRRFE